jgi:anti-sigma regulatory factor (Ser/Thr protein kinase)
MRGTGGRLQTDYPPLHASAAEMRRTLRRYLAEEGVDEAAAYGVVLAADEAFINAVTHAGDGGHDIRVSACVTHDEVRVEVRDGGGGFRYRRWDPRTIPDVRRANGRGIYLIERTMDEVSVRSGRRGTTVYMVKCLA